MSCCSRKERDREKHEEEEEEGEEEITNTNTLNCIYLEIPKENENMLTMA